MHDHGIPATPTPGPCPDVPQATRAGTSAAETTSSQRIALAHQTRARSSQQHVQPTAPASDAHVDNCAPLHLGSRAPKPQQSQANSRLKAVAAPHAAIRRALFSVPKSNGQWPMHGHGTGGRMYKACVAGGVLRGTHRDRRGTPWASRCTCAPQKRGLRASEPEAQALCTSALQLQAHSGRGAGCTKHVWRAGCCGARTATGAGRPGRRGAPARRGWEGCERASRAQVALCTN